MSMIKELRSVAGYESLLKDMKLRDINPCYFGDNYHCAGDYNQMMNELLILPIKEAVQEAKFKQLKRGYEGE